jgi:hypothetical protein
MGIPQDGGFVHDGPEPCFHYSVAFSLKMGFLQEGHFSMMGGFEGMTTCCFWRQALAAGIFVGGENVIFHDECENVAFGGKHFSTTSVKMLLLATGIFP